MAELRPTKRGQTPFTFLVTGGAGFIGSHIVDRLLEDGHKVRVLDDFSTGRAQNIQADAGVDILEGSIMDTQLLARSMKGIDFVLHQAAIPSVARSIENPQASLRVNAQGTLQLLMAAHEAKIKRVIVASSSSVYGANPGLPKEESMTPEPISPYASSKLAAEYYAYVYHKVYGLPTIALRYFNVFGPRQNPSSQYAAVIAKFTDVMLEGRRPEVFGDGRQSRDFTYVENVVEANILACQAPAKACGQVYNIATAGRISLLELVKQLNRQLKTDLTPILAAPRSRVSQGQGATCDTACVFLSQQVWRVPSPP
jgi:nucleoside-diphosphate-sugar epimerase